VPLYRSVVLCPAHSDFSCGSLAGTSMVPKSSFFERSRDCRFVSEVTRSGMRQRMVLFDKSLRPPVRQQQSSWHSNNVTERLLQKGFCVQMDEGHQSRDGVVDANESVG